VIKNFAQISVYNFESLGKTYQGLSEIEKKTGLEVIEFFGGPAQFFIVVGMADLEQKNWSPSSAMAVQRIENPDTRILKAMYSLSNAPLQKALLVIEGSEVGMLFQISNMALSLKAEIVDFKINRSGGESHLLLTGGSEELSTINKKAKELQLKSELVQGFGTEFSKLFELNL
jgi:hypothetical protein